MSDPRSSVFARGAPLPSVGDNNAGVSRRPLPAPSGMPNAPYALRSGRFRKLQDGEPVADVFDPARYARLNGELVIPIGTTPLLVLPGPSNLRNFLGFRNSSAADTSILFLSFGAPATLNSWLRLSQNVIALFDTVVMQDDVWCICNEATGQLTLVSSTTPGETA